jgi:two-component system OmpR family sensor kinase
VTSTVTEPTDNAGPINNAGPTSNAGPTNGEPIAPSQPSEPTIDLGSAGSPQEAPAAGGGRRRPRWMTRNPLRVKLVAAMLALVAFALFVIGAASVFALRDYLVKRMDNQLWAAQARLENLTTTPQTTKTEIGLPSDFVIAVQNYPQTTVAWDPTFATALPPFPADLSSLRSRAGAPFTVDSADHAMHWRLLVSTPSQGPFAGRVVVVGESLTGVEQAVGQLIFINTSVGVSVLAALALVGVWLVRASLRPLAAMERTAAAIARGDLTQRVPELDPRTELGQFSAALNTMLAQIEAAFTARASSEHRAVRSEGRMRQFVADASHELRTPLTTIRGFAELYRQGAAPDPAEVLRRIEDEAARMGLLVEDLLLLARLDQERPLHLGPVALADLIEDAAAAAHAVAPERSVLVDIQQPSDGLVVLGDETRLRQVLANLVTNAITHTPEGTSVALRLRSDGEQHAIIEVSDQGPGLTPEQAEHVFERFYRVDKARTRRAATRVSLANGLTAPHSGSGLGLAIVAALVAAHSGDVEVDTAPGRGATFRVRLPLMTA